ncbi:MAG TPA: DUF4115 domain-containing protein [Thiobacillus sp.]|nr:MAG: helix-turn-helix domain-containing protein [Hydrogenophilales bacterium 28-61-11]OYZ56873.1 MAG: helix-turn-helix domain-containing protein [Hydrogenophilales bacterium 16-61-112]HQT31380.1 DUF4115 domain-containing protein [Thiobacillus sp.]HQT70769.1 DUF4115 domain-containing protein [Thiobacillus sp.]
MSELNHATVGQVLHAAREAQGLTLENAAVRLRLMQRQIEAMETDDFSSLGQPVFARGFVRNYARLLGLAPEPLLARMDGAPSEAATVSPLPPPLPDSWLTSPWLLLLLTGGLLAVTMPVALYWWLNSESAEVRPRPISASQPASRQVLKPSPAPAKISPVAESPVAESPVSPALSATTVSPVVPSDAIEAPVVPAANGRLHLELGADSWTEVKDSSGKMLARKLVSAGSSLDVQGMPPFDLVIGNAPQALLTYNGRPIDLKPFVDGTVARFTLEE